MKEEIKNCSHSFRFSHTEKGHNNPSSTMQIDIYYDVCVCEKCGEVVRMQKPFIPLSPK